MLTSDAMLGLAAELTDAQARDDAESLAVIAWKLYAAVGENLAEIGRLRAAIRTAWNRAPRSPATGSSRGLSGTAGTGGLPAAGLSLGRVVARDAYPVAAGLA
jgi:cytochrome c biogenesis protein CcdA